MSATAAATAFWACHRPAPEWLAHYEASQSQPWRADIVAALKRLPGWVSLYEIGCHVGPLLQAVRAAFPAATVSGCDVCAGAVERAVERGLDVTLGAFPRVTRTWADQSVDVVVSCYTLAYIAPDAIAEALAEAARIARVAVVLCEPMSWNQQTGKRAAVTFDEWQHPYLALLTQTPACEGWTAECRRVQYDQCGLSGLIAAVRP